MIQIALHLSTKLAGREESEVFHSIVEGYMAELSADSETMEEVLKPSVRLLFQVRLFFLL